MLLDAGTEGSRIALWIRRKKRVEKVMAPYSVKIYLTAKDNREAVETLESGGYSCGKTVFRDLLTDRLVEGVEVSTDRLSDTPAFVRSIERLGGYRWQLYNADFSPEQMFMFDHGLNPLSWIDYKARRRVLSSVSKRSDCMNPGFRVSRIRVVGEYNPRINFGCRVKKLVFDNHTFIGGEKRILSNFRDQYGWIDPDIILVDYGDSYATDYIKHRFGKNGLEFDFGRAPDRFSGWRGKSFHSYGRVVRRNPGHYLSGRYHIDAGSFLYREAGLEGLFELARITSAPVQKVARLSPGASITSLYLYTAYSLGYPVPYKHNMVEDFKTARLLLDADKGGMIYEPVTGFHRHVAEIDFVSLYPNIMVNYNLSPETILCRCCPDNKSIPVTGYHVCREKTGIIPRVLKPVLARRRHLKRLYARTGEEKYRGMSNALKWILVTSFGYMGYRKSRFARIEAHESITSVARDVLMRSSQIAEKQGFRVLHGIVDSLWLQRDGASVFDVEKPCRIIEEGVGIPLEVEGLYKWIVFNPSVNSPVSPAPNRYYGVFEDGTIKVRGIEARRRDAPRIVKDFQMRVLSDFAVADTFKEFKARIPGAFDTLSEYARRLEKGDAGPDELCIRKRLTRPADDYKGEVAQKIVLDRLAGLGYDRQPGESIGYVIRDAGCRVKKRRYSPIECFDGVYDAGKYVELLCRALESLLTPFGYDDERISGIIGERGQSRLSSF